MLEPDLDLDRRGRSSRGIQIASAGTAGSRPSARRTERRRADRRPRSGPGCRALALLPGFVDTHSHAFQRGLRGQGESVPAGAGSFWTWREAMYALVDSLDRASLRRISARAFGEMRDAGITTVGEFHYVHHEREGDFALDDAIVEAAADAGIRMVLLYSFYATGAPGRPLAGGQRRFSTPTVDEFWRQVDRLGASDSIPLRRRWASRRTASAPRAPRRSGRSTARRPGAACPSTCTSRSSGGRSRSRSPRMAGRRWR